MVLRFRESVAPITLPASRQLGKITKKPAQVVQAGVKNEYRLQLDQQRNPSEPDR